ncbi:unnamed protein product [Arabis nemorensis]|uniref:LRAT domain-containing protein n=1 Tax=Arabis nemorensis TaxID=586526 RepID=A0A565CMC4_9BRAS|nr:unnamed protein product [Arabis nemorensis]
MGLIFHKISRDKLRPGDHIYSWRAAYIYAHHGIYIGDGKVIHFTRRHGTGTFLDKIFLSSNPPKQCLSCGDQSNLSGVLCSCLDCFLDGGDLYLFDYGVKKVVLMAKIRSGTCTTAPTDASEQVIARANYLLLHNCFGNYHTFENNCEDFAIYCKTSLLVGENYLLGRTGQASSVSATSIATNMISGFDVWGIRSVIRLYKDIGVRKDAAKVPVEILRRANAREG